MFFLKKLIKNNTGVSSKNFFLVSITIIGCILLLIPAISLLIEVFHSYTIASSLEGFAAYIGAVASLFATAGITKAWSEKYEQGKKPKNNDETDEIIEDEINTDL